MSAGLHKLKFSQAASTQRIRVDTQDGALQLPRILDRRVRIGAARRCRVIDGQHHIGLPAVYED